MGFISKLFGEEEAFFIEGSGSYDQELVGESHYQKHLKKLSGGYKKEGNRVKVIVRLHHENSNPHDNRAIRAAINGKTVGYLPKEHARAFRWERKKAGQEGVVCSCDGIIVGGKKVGLFKKTYFGVWIDIDGLDDD